MDGLIVLLILIPLIFLILLIVIAVRTGSQQENFDNLNNKLEQLSRKFDELQKDRTKPEHEPSTSIPWATAAKKVDTAPIEIKPPAPKIEEPKPSIIIQKSEPEEVPVEKEAKAAITSAQGASEPTPPIAAKNFWNTNLDEKTDWEKFIGENLANKIGIAILVLGISFFVKFAIDKEWINETGRVVIGLVCGGILISLAHYTRLTYRSFSSVLVGGGLSVFYFTIAYAFHEYHLIGQQAAFIVMVIITAFAVIISILYNRIELAILATIGGFITPFLLNTGQNNFVALFSYLSILNTGLLVLSWFKRWKAINIIALIFTVIIFGGWLINQEAGQRAYNWAFVFATIFYLQFVAMNVISNLKLNLKFNASDFLTLLTINGLYYLAGIVVLDYLHDGEFKGLFTAALGLLNLVLAWSCYRQKKADKNFIYLLIGLTLTFISLAAPIQLEGNNITLFWAAEAVVLFWLYQRSRIIILKIASPVIVVLMLISLFMDWFQLYQHPAGIIPVLANRGFITTFVSAIALLIYYRMMRNEADSNYLPDIGNRHMRNALLAGSIILFFSSGAWEIYYQFKTRLPGSGVYAIYFQLYVFAFILLLLPIFKKWQSFTLLKLLLTLAAMTIYLFHLRVNYKVSVELLSSGKNTIHIIAHWIAAAALGFLLVDMISYFRKRKISFADYENPFTWIVSLCLILLLSVEMYHVFMWMNYESADQWVYWENLFYKAGLSILWGLCSFAMMWLGMKHKFKALRIISLSLFSVTLLKLFFYDIQNIPPGGKIAAFILLGVLLLIISFMYQRLKKIIIDDQKEI